MFEIYIYVRLVFFAAASKLKSRTVKFDLHLKFWCHNLNRMHGSKTTKTVS